MLKEYSKRRLVFVFRDMGTGGAQKIQAFVANACFKTGYDVQVLSLADSPVTVDIDNGIPIKLLDYDRISKEAIPPLLRDADICLAHCSMNDSGQSFKYGVSKNKIIEYLYADACVIYGFEDPEDFVATSGGGIVVKPFDSQAMAKAVAEVYAMPDEKRKLYGINGMRYIEENHRVQALAEKIVPALGCE